MRWTFGVDALPEAVRATPLLRRIVGSLLSIEAADARTEEAIEHLRAADELLAAQVPPDHRPRVGDAVDGDGRAYIDHSHDIGAYDAVFPDYALAVDGDRATGTVRFPVAYEGPPGLVHGGFLAVFFDCAIQHHNCEVGVAGKTTSLALRYRRPTPLEVDLEVELERSVDDGRIRSTGWLRRDGDLLCEATMEAVAGDRANLPAVSPRKVGT